MSSWNIATYSEVGLRYDNRDLAYAALGVGSRCTTHCARMVKHYQCAWFLRCRLRNSDPPCHWTACIVELGRGPVEVRYDPAHKEHNQGSEAQGSRGAVPQEARQRIASLLEAMPQSTPRALLQAVRNEYQGIDISLKDVQLLKRDRRRGARGEISLGDLAQAVLPLREVPPPDKLHEPFVGFEAFWECKGGKWRLQRVMATFAKNGTGF